MKDSDKVLAKMIAFDKECVYTHLVSDPPLWDEWTPWQKFQHWLHNRLP